MGEVFESDEQEKKQTKDENKNWCADSWEKLKPKPKDDSDVNDVLSLGKGKAPEIPKADAKKEDLGIIPKVKKVQPELVEESPHERLKRLENATPIERDIGLEYKYEETKLPEY